MIACTWALTEATSRAVLRATSSWIPLLRRNGVLHDLDVPAHVPLELIQLLLHPRQQRRKPLLVVAQRRQHLVVVDGQERVDEGLLAFLLVVSPDDLRAEGDLAEER